MGFRYSRRLRGSVALRARICALEVGTVSKHPGLFGLPMEDYKLTVPSTGLESRPAKETAN